MCKTVLQEHAALQERIKEGKMYLTILEEREKTYWELSSKIVLFLSL
jgi:hypothetical protein